MLRPGLPRLLAGLLLLVLSGCQQPAAQAPDATPSPAGASPAQTSPRPSADSDTAITAERLQPVDGVARLEQGNIVPVIVETSAGSFQIGLYEGLAAKAVPHLLKLVVDDAYAGTSVDRSHPERLVFSGKVKEGTPVRDPNLAQPARGAVFFDGTSRLAVLLSSHAAPEGWTCVGQALIAGPVLSALRSSTNITVQKIFVPVI